MDREKLSPQRFLSLFESDLVGVLKVILPQKLSKVAGDQLIAIMNQLHSNWDENECLSNRFPKANRRTIRKTSRALSDCWPTNGILENEVSAKNLIGSVISFLESLPYTYSESMKLKWEKFDINQISFSSIAPQALRSEAGDSSQTVSDDEQQATLSLSHPLPLTLNRQLLLRVVLANVKKEVLAAHIEDVSCIKIVSIEPHKDGNIILLKTAEDMQTLLNSSVLYKRRQLVFEEIVEQVQEQASPSFRLDNIAGLNAAQLADAIDNCLDIQIPPSNIYISGDHAEVTVETEAKAQELQAFPQFIFKKQQVKITKVTPNPIEPKERLLFYIV